MAKLEELEELRQDLESHPERGMIEGSPVVREGTEKIEITLTIEQYREVLWFSAARGMPVSTGAARLLDIGLANSEERARTRENLQFKAEMKGVPFAEILNKVLGLAKRRTRERKLSILEKRVK